MLPIATCVLLLVPQQPRVEGLPATVGQEVRLSLAAAEGPHVGVAVEVEGPDGARHPIGVTDVAGIVRFVPQHAGQHVFVATLAASRTLAPFYVNPARPKWSLALGAVPLGLVLLWGNLRRARGRRAP